MSVRGSKQRRKRAASALPPRNSQPGLPVPRRVLVARGPRHDSELYAGINRHLAFMLDRWRAFDGRRCRVASRRPVAFHCSCHQRRGLRDTTSGATLIASLPNVELVEQVDADSCCGFGGTFAIKFPGVSTAMGRDKVDHVHEAGAGELVSGDLGCLLHLGGVAAENQVALATTTLPELLDREGWTP